MKIRIVFIFGLICLVIPVLGANSYQMIEQDLESITRHSSIILRGVCQNRMTKMIYPETAPRGIMVTHYVFSMMEALKGSPSNPFEFDVYGTSRQEALETGTPYAVGFYQFEVGKEYVVFLTGPSSIGVYAPMGMTQGVFDVVYSEAGKATVVNNYSNKSLFRGMTKTTKGAKAMKAAGIDASSGSPKGPLLYEDLKRLVNVLQSK